jgi:hypothetical protein
MIVRRLLPISAGAIASVALFLTTHTEVVLCQSTGCPAFLTSSERGWNRRNVKFDLSGLAADSVAYSAAVEALSLWASANQGNNSQIEFKPAVEGQTAQLKFSIAQFKLTIQGIDRAAGMYPIGRDALGNLTGANILVDINNLGTPPPSACTSSMLTPCKFWIPGGDNYFEALVALFVHEIGHTMGLQDVNLTTTPPPTERQLRFSMMSSFYVANDCIKLPGGPRCLSAVRNPAPKLCDMEGVNAKFTQPPPIVADPPSGGGGGGGGGSPEPGPNQPLPSPVLPPPGGYDFDGDGYPAGQDCNDGSRFINPGLTHAQTCDYFARSGFVWPDMNCNGDPDKDECTASDFTIYFPMAVAKPAPASVEEASPDCMYTVAPRALTIAPGGEIKRAGIVPSEDECYWSASSTVPWITIEAVEDGYGVGSVAVGVQPNSSSVPRSAAITVAGQQVVINQDGVGCSFALSLNAVDVGAAATAVSTTLSASPGTCAWTAAANVSWLHVASGGSGTGNGAVSIGVDANSGASPRTGTASIAGRTFSITQGGASVPFGRITSPAEGAQVSRNTPLLMQVEASDPDGNVSQVEFYAGGVFLGNDTAAPYAFSWANPVGGRIILTAVVIDNLGNSFTTSGVPIEINSLDSISVTPSNPQAGQPATVTFTGANPCGAVMVDYGDGRPFRTIPLSGLPAVETNVTWSQPGPKTIRAIGQADCVGEVSTTSNIGGNAPPTVSLLTPASAANVPEGGTIALSASASDVDGDVQRVEFYSGGGLLSVAFSPPYQFNWSNMLPGTYSVYARAVDSHGAMATSANATVSVAPMVTGVSVIPGQIVAGQVATVSGVTTAQCTAVNINFGDGSNQTLATNGASFSVQHTWSTGGTKTITATGQGTCVGSISTSLSVLQPNPLMSVDAPVHNSAVNQTFTLGGWAVDTGAPTGTGVSAIHVWAYPNPGSGASPFFIGAPTYGGARPDVGAWLGGQFTNSGYGMFVTLQPGTYQLAVHALSTVTNTFNQVQTVTVTVAASNPAIAVDQPAPSAVVGSQFWVTGWAIDLGSPSGPGIDQVNVVVYPNGDWNSPIVIGPATYGHARTDVGAYYGAQFTNSGYARLVSGLSPGTYMIVVWTHSTVSGGWPSGIRWVTVQ